MIPNLWREIHRLIKDATLNEWRMYAVNIPLAGESSLRIGLLL